MDKKLSARVASATLLDDRRDSIRALKSMSKKFRREVTEFGLASILELIREENDSECRSLALDSILILIGADDDQDIPCPVARDTALHISQSKDLISLFFNVLDDGNGSHDFIFLSIVNDAALTMLRYKFIP